MSVFVELNRRNIFRVALLYIVAAWLLLESIYLLFALLGAPDWVFRFAFALLLIGFPLVLAFSWVFEITPDGLKREQIIESQSSITKRTGQKITRITLIVLIAAVLIALLRSVVVDSDATQQTHTNIESTVDELAAMNSNFTPEAKDIELQGHRGARGLMPENSIPAFLLALDLGVDTLELDVAINAEGHVVVSHEPWMSATICKREDGSEITPEEEKSLRIYAMSDAQVASFDCGSRGHPDHRQQQTMPVAKPLLSQVFEAVAKHAVANDKTARTAPVLYNIEIKSKPEGDGVFHPPVKEFAEILYQLVSDHQLVEQTTIQSFDTRALEAMHEIDADISISLLVDNPHGLEPNLSLLSFTPQIYSPDHTLLDQIQIDAAHDNGIRVIPWTVNDAKTMRQLIDLGVDGFITDYPDLGARVLAEIQQAQ